MRWAFSVALLAFVLSSSCAAQGVAQNAAVTHSSHPSPELTRASASRLTTAELVRLLFPDQPAGRFVTHEVGKPDPHFDALTTINFYQKPTQVGGDLCRRDVTVVW